MTIKPMKFILKKTLMVGGHEVGEGTYVGQKLLATEIERLKSRKASYFLHLAPQAITDGLTAVQRFDLDVTDFVEKGQIIIE